IRIKRHILHSTVPPVWHASQILIPLIRHLRLRRPYAGQQYHATLSTAVHDAMRKAPWKPDFLLSMYVDIWLTKRSLWRDKRILPPIPWGGVRFMPFEPRYAGREGYFQ